MIPPEEDIYYVDQIQKHHDQDSFGELYSRHFQLVYRIIAKIILDEAVAEELAQDTFMKAAEHIHLFRKRSSFKTWVCKIGVNTAQAHLRRELTVKRHESNLLVDAEGRSLSLTPRDSLFWKDEHQKVSRAMAELNPLLRTSLVLTAIEGHEVSEAAQMQGCSKATMYWRIHQARKELKEVLGYE